MISPLKRGGDPGNVLHYDRYLRGGGGLYIFSPTAQLRFSLSTFYIFVPREMERDCRVLVGCLGGGWGRYWLHGGKIGFLFESSSVPEVDAQ